MRVEAIVAAERAKDGHNGSRKTGPSRIYGSNAKLKMPCSGDFIDTRILFRQLDGLALHSDGPTD